MFRTPNHVTVQCTRDGFRNGFLPSIAPATVKVGLNNHTLFEPDTILTGKGSSARSLMAILYQLTTESEYPPYVDAVGDGSTIRPDENELAAIPIVFHDAEHADDDAAVLTGGAGNEGPTSDADQTGCTHVVDDPHVSYHVAEDIDTNEGVNTVPATTINGACVEAIPPRYKTMPALHQLIWIIT